MEKIIATDLDGTLFYPKDTKEMISKPNLFFLQNFIDNGGKTILISGRSHLYCQKTVKKIISVFQKRHLSMSITKIKQ